MKLTKSKLKQIIKEELEATLVDEGFMDKLKGLARTGREYINPSGARRASKGEFKEKIKVIGAELDAFLEAGKDVEAAQELISKYYRENKAAFEGKKDWARVVADLLINKVTQLGYKMGKTPETIASRLGRKGAKDPANVESAKGLADEYEHLGLLANMVDKKAGFLRADIEKARQQLYAKWAREYGGKKHDPEDLKDPHAEKQRARGRADAEEERRKKYGSGGESESTRRMMTRGG